MMQQACARSGGLEGLQCYAFLVYGDRCDLWLCLCLWTTDASSLMRACVRSSRDSCALIKSFKAYVVQLQYRKFGPGYAVSTTAEGEGGCATQCTPTRTAVRAVYRAQRSCTQYRLQLYTLITRSADALHLDLTHS